MSVEGFEVWFGKKLRNQVSKSYSMIFEGTFQGIFPLENIVMNGANVLQNSYLSYSCPFVKNLKIAGSAKEEGTRCNV